MRNYNLQIRCAICASTEVVTSNDPEKKIHELVSDAYQADNSKIDPYFKLPVKVLSGGKGEPNWIRVELCETCRNQWAGTVLPGLAQALNDFKSGS